MEKLLALYDKYILKIGVSIAIAFIALYPKLPSIQVTHTWVYIRLEDFLIALLGIIWIVQVLRKKVKLPFTQGWAIVLYWIIGLASLLYCLAFIAPHLAHFFPKIAWLQYLRRIEYMILFFIGFSGVRDKKDIRDYIIILFATITGLSLYAIGQRFYLQLWHMFPEFFKQFPFCFPAFLTGNEEFAKGTPLCLTETSRITSTFGGHYDLAAYLVFTIPILLGVFLAVKRWYLKIITALIGMLSIVILNFTSSRVSFGSYIVGIIAMLIIWKKKWWIIPVLLVTFLIVGSSKGDTLQRIVKTIQPVNVVTVQDEGKQLPQNLQNIIKKTKEKVENTKPEKPPPGSVTIGKGITKTPSKNTTTTVIDDETLALLNKDNVAISTVSGSFLIQKAYALDVSITTRFQAEWPRNWNAFMMSPVFGTGYSSLTLATDNDYLRALGETGALGLISFLLIFIVLGIYMRKAHTSSKDTLLNGFVFGLAGGVIGLLVNAIMIDVFEASKVAESLWLLLGIGAGGLALHYKKTIDYKKELVSFFTSRALICIYILLAAMAVFVSSINNFFIADDFTWLRWAAESNISDIPKYFIDAQGFFYRPIDKTVMYMLYTLFSFQPQGYHLFAIFSHIAMTIGVFLVTDKIFKKRIYSTIAGFLFLVLPAHAENIYWISTISTNLAAVFMIYGLLAFLYVRENKSWFAYIIVILSGILAMLSYEMAVVYPLLLIAADLCLFKDRKWKQYLLHIPVIFLSLAYIPLRTMTHTVAAGGDYAYNAYHFIPNFFGNLIGYFGLFIFGEQSLPTYTALRLGMKPYALPVLVILVVAIVLMICFGRKLLRAFIQQRETNIIIFGILIIIVGLLPVLGLGNIAQRYGYFGSVGFVLIIAALAHVIITRLHRWKLYAYIVSFVLMLLFVCWAVRDLHKEKAEWGHAGKITYRTLSSFRLNYPTFPPYTTLYIHNMPIREKEAWMFPVGFADGLWFIYRDETLQVKKVKTIEEGMALKAQTPQGLASYVFTFDKNKKIMEVK